MSTWSGCRLPILLSSERIGEIEDEILFAVADATPTAYETLSLIGETLDALAPQPGATNGRRLSHRVLDVVHSGKAMGESSTAIQRRENSIFTQKAEARVNLTQLVVQSLHGSGSGGRRASRLSPPRRIPIYSALV